MGAADRLAPPAFGRARRGTGLFDHAQGGAAAAAGVEVAAAVGLQPADEQAGGHVQALLHRAAGRIDAADLAGLALPGAVPELAVHPGHAGHKAVGLQRAANRAGGRVDLMDLARAVFAHPQAALGPGQARVAALAGRRNGRQHAAADRVDLVDARLGDLVEMLAVEGRARIGGLGQAAQHRAGGGVDGQQFSARGGPDAVAVVRDAGDRRHALEGPELSQDLGGLVLGCHRSLLGASPGAWRQSTQAAARRGVTRSS
mmetsp:Transcript_23675/g.56340  ORF Transcript_23675/g.56340 Transcript_23675/m.56340 type:complete len:258 (-) Transcript_23675:185-958(-)